MTACRDCALLDGQGPTEPPHSHLKLVRRSRHHAVLALFFQCTACGAELSFLPGRTAEQHGWRIFTGPGRPESLAEAA
jgi:hypothetical protein